MRWGWMIGPQAWTCGARNASGDDWCYHYFRWSRRLCIWRRTRAQWRAAGGLRAPRASGVPPKVEGWIYLAVTSGEAATLVDGTVPEAIRVRLQRQLEAHARLVG